MIMRFDPFRDLDRLAGEAFGAARTPALMPMDCLRTADSIVVRFDMPGIDADSLDVSTENNTLTVRGERHRHDLDDVTYLVSERPSGTYRRQLVLGDGLNLERVHADYHDGVLTLTIPVAEKAKPRKIQITRGDASTAISTHEGRPMIGGEAASREPATATA
ncbi:Hsp20/alpha crystallin family protein [Catellatospora vulcania]|uniref:Hsp20/alpha crystallin family protein n=1 Tax=Catellatospora vulcania TaxID=1460450 RepID=UPI0012D44F1B|nr:HSP20 family small heat-shock protein [Catellatospora vulcania]